MTISSSCLTCGASLPARKPGVPGRRRHYCTASCSSVAPNVRERTKLRAQTAQTRAQAEKMPYPCAKCGAPIEPKRSAGRPRIQCADCYQKSERERQRTRYRARKRSDQT